MTRHHLLGILALAVSASVAAAQPAPSPAKSKAKPHTRSVSANGEVSRSTPHAVARDWVRADDTKGDDLWQREQMMDRRCGKDRDKCGKR
jgi:hypothetical protein